ncbi:MAG: 6-phosphogluconolactonase [Chitinivibrionales bacterium]
MENIELPGGSHHRIRYFKGMEEAAELSIDVFKPGARIALSGGSTYKELFRIWRETGTDLSKTEFFPVDERSVGFETCESNWGNAYRHFLKYIGRERDRENHMRSKEYYERLLSEKFGSGTPVFDTVFLGAGRDGHTASIFLRTLEQDQDQGSVIETHSLEPPVSRITLTPGVISSAANVITVVSGEGKQGVVKGIMEGNTDLPVVWVLSRCRDSEILIDSRLAKSG